MMELKHGMGDPVKQEEVIKPKPQTKRCCHSLGSGLQRIILFLEQLKNKLVKKRWNFNEHSE